jgi:hypothetical protein
MKIKCPICETEFDWEQPEDTVIYKMITAHSLEESGTKRFVATCPNPECKQLITIEL